VDAAHEAGRLLENLPSLWEEASVGERRRILTTMLDAVYVEIIEEMSVVAIRPKPAFRALFDMATTREGSRVVLYNEQPPTQEKSEAGSFPCCWWRRGRVDLGLKHDLTVLVAA